MRKHFSTFIIIFFLSKTFLLTSLYAQEGQELHSYTNDSGDFFWPMKLPMYLHISDKTQGEGSVLLNSKLTPEKTNPLFFEKEGLNLIRSKWAVDENGKTLYPKKEVAFEIYVDGASPILNIDFSNKSYVSEYDDLFYSGDTEISISGTDQTSGIQDILTSLNNSSFNAYKKPISFQNEGDYLFEAKAIDHVGNRSLLFSENFIIDATPPLSNTNIKIDFKGSILSVRSQLTINVDDQLSGVKETYFSIDGSEYERYTDKVKISDLNDGEHVLTFYSIDNVGNKEDDKEYEFYLDKKAPEIYATLIGDQYQNRGRIFVSDRSNVQLTATDNKAGTKLLSFQIDGGETKEYIESFVLNKSEGIHYIKVVAIDEVGNKFEELFDERNLGRKGLDIDMVPPVVQHEFNGPQYFRNDTLFITSTTDISLAASDAESGINKLGYKLNSGSGQEYLGSFKLKDEGAYKVDFFATDNIYNRNSDEFFFAVDNSGPKVFSHFSSRAIGNHLEKDKEVDVYAKGVLLYLAATDDKIETENIYFKINESDPQKYIAPISLNSSGINIITVNAKDKLGNITKEDLEMTVMIK